MFYTEADRRAGLPLELLLKAREDGRVEHTGWRVRKDGTRFWGDVVITAIHDEGGHLTGYTKVTRDLTEEHALELALRASEERFRLLVGQVSDYAIIALDPQGAIETWNLGAERVKQYTAEEAIGRSFAMFYTEEDRRTGLPMQAAQRGARERSGRAHRLAAPQGRHPVLGRRRHHRPARHRGQPDRLRQGDSRPHRAARPRGEAARQRGAAPPPGGSGGRLRDRRPRSSGRHRDLEPRRRAGQGLHRGGGHRSELRDVLHRGRPARGPAVRAAHAGPRDRPRRAHRLAGAQGRVALLGRCRDHRAPRRGRQPDRLREGHPRPHGHEGDRGRPGRLLRRLQPRLQDPGDRLEGVRRHAPGRRSRGPGHADRPGGVQCRPLAGHGRGPHPVRQPARRQGGDPPRGHRPGPGHAQRGP